MKRKIINLAIYLLIVIIFVVVVIYDSISPSMTTNDIEIEGKVIAYDYSDKNLLVELNIKRLNEEKADHIIYLATNEFSNVSLIRENSYYTPNNHIAWWISDEKLINSIQEEIGIKSLSFKIPISKGKYKLKLAIDQMENLQKITELEILYLHMEKRYGKDLTWKKKYFVPIEF